jgi:Ca2+-binding EF-hand superfamily protein
MIQPGGMPYTNRPSAIGRATTAGTMAFVADGDGTISLQEFQAAHERIFKAMDSNKDGKLTLEAMQAFIHGTR